MRTVQCTNSRPQDPRRGSSRTLPRLATAALLALLALLALAGCGGDDEPIREITVAQPGAPFPLDPAYAYTEPGAEAVRAAEALALVYTPLLTYRHVSGSGGSELIPGLAQQLPEVSDDGLTYTLALREGIRYSNGTGAQASDFEHSVKRVLRAGTPAADLLGGIAGAATYAAQDDPGAPIAGIEADDRTGEITIRLAEPDASFAHVLALWFAGLVPRSTRFLDRSDSPPPGVGPYEIVDDEADRGFALARSDSFGALDIPDIPTGNLDRMNVEVTGGVAEQAQAVLENRLDYIGESPPPDVKSTLLSRDDERYREQPAPATQLFMLDSGSPPFDDPRVREAANLAIDHAAIAHHFDGELEPGCSLLPPEVPGYDAELDLEGCPYGDPDEPPDVARAVELVTQADATGAPVTVVGADEDGIGEATEAFAEMLATIGLDAEAQLLPAGELERRIATAGAPGDAWFASIVLDFPHPLNAYAQVVDGAPGRTLGLRHGAIDGPEVAAELERLNLEPDVDAVAEEWAALDRDLVSPPRSLVAVLGHPRRTTFVSERLDLDRIVTHPVFGNDHATFALAAEEER